MTLKVKVNELHISYQPWVFLYACFVQTWRPQPKSMKNDRTDKPNLIEFWVKMDKMTLNVNVKVNDHFQNQPNESTPGCMLGVNLMIPPQICDELSRRQADFPRILSQNDLEGQGQWYFQNKLRVSRDACLVPIWWYQLKFVMSYRADMVKFRTDRQTGRETDGQTERRR